MSSLMSETEQPSLRKRVTSHGVLVMNILLAGVILWRAPAVIVARTGLGTINHSLLTIEALRSRGISIHGMAFVGAAEEDSETTICAIGGVRRLGRLPMLESLDADSLALAFSDNFALEDFQ